MKFYSITSKVQMVNVFICFNSKYNKIQIIIKLNTYNDNTIIHCQCMDRNGHKIKVILQLRGELGVFSTDSHPLRSSLE